MRILSTVLAVILLVASVFAASPKTVTFELSNRTDYTSIYAYTWSYPDPAIVNGDPVNALTLGGPQWTGHTWQAVKYQLGKGNATIDAYKPCAVLYAWAEASIINGAVTQQACTLALTIELNSQADVDNFVNNLNANPDTDPLTNQIIVATAHLALLDVPNYSPGFYHQFTVYSGIGLDDYGIQAGFGDGSKGWNNFLVRNH